MKLFSGVSLAVCQTTYGMMMLGAGLAVFLIILFIYFEANKERE